MSYLHLHSFSLSLTLFHYPSLSSLSSVGSTSHESIQRLYEDFASGIAHNPSAVLVGPWPCHSTATFPARLYCPTDTSGRTARLWNITLQVGRVNSLTCLYWLRIRIHIVLAFWTFRTSSAWRSTSCCLFHLTPLSSLPIAVNSMCAGKVRQTPASTSELPGQVPVSTRSVTVGPM
jgi:hypothetical protein